MIDDARLIFEAYREFELRIVRQPWGIKLEMKNAPGSAFVDGEMIKGVKEHLFAVLRDVVYTSTEVMGRTDDRRSTLDRVALRRHVGVGQAAEVARLMLGNTLVTVQMTGAELLAYLQAAAAMTPGSGAFPQRNG